MTKHVYQLDKDKIYISSFQADDSYLLKSNETLVAPDESTYPPYKFNGVAGIGVSYEEWARAHPDEAKKIHKKNDHNWEPSVPIESAKGKNGDSAYDIAKRKGFKGTEKEWLQSLKGEDGATPVLVAGITTTVKSNEEAKLNLKKINDKYNAYRIDLKIPKGERGLQGPQGLNGKDGLSAYEIAKRNGFTGTEKEWSDSLQNQSFNKTTINKIFDKYSNKFHINMPDNGFLNDVQGAFYRNGIWHMYFLYNGDAKYNSNGDQIGGNGTEWYHVTTKDWVKWNYEGVAIHKYKTAWGDVASGTIYIDFDNRFGKGKDAVIVFATAYGGDKGQNVMGYYSTDNGYTFSPLQTDPILRHVGGSDTNFRDPYLFRMGDTWVIYMAEGDKFGIYTSNNPLSGYSYIDGYYAPHPLLECPSLFKLNVNGDQNNQKWVLFYGGNGGDDATTGTYASVGYLTDKYAFKAEQENIRVDYGPDFYGAKMFSNEFGNNDFVYSNAWMGNWGYATKVPNEGRIGAISLTRKITLRHDGVKYCLNNDLGGVYPNYLSNPIVDTNVATNLRLPNFRGDSFYFKLHLKGIKNYRRNISIKILGNEYDVDYLMDFSKNTVRAHRYNTLLSGDSIFSKDRSFPIDLNDHDDIWIEFYVDRTSIEIKFPDGNTYTTSKYPKGESHEAIIINADEKIIFDYEYYQIEEVSSQTNSCGSHAKNARDLKKISERLSSMFVNILDFGAQPENVNFDSAPAFNKAIQALPPVGGTVFVPNGNYFLKSTVTVDRSYVHIMGFNNGLRSGIDPADGSTQTGGGGAKVTVQNPITAFRLENTHNDKRLSGITFSGFDLRGDTNGGIGIDGVSNSDRTIIDNMTINNVGIGVRLYGADAPRITNSWIAETQSSILLTGASQQAEIKNNSLGAQPNGTTIYMENPDRYNISGNNIYPDGASSIRILNPVHGAIVGNTISAYYNGMIEFLPNPDGAFGNGNVISSNVIAVESWHNNPDGKDNKWGIIHVEAFNNVISGNNILANGTPKDTTGILVMKGDYNRIANNVITIPDTNAKVVINGAANNNWVIYSTEGSAFQDGDNPTNKNIGI